MKKSKFNYSDLVVNIFLLLITYAIYFIVSKYTVIDYNYYLDSEYAIYVKIIIFTLSIITMFYMLGLPVFSYFRVAQTIFFYRKGDVKISWGYGSSMVWCALFLNMMLLPLIAYACFDLPILSFIIIYLISAIFGFSLAIESRFENMTTGLSDTLEKQLRLYFDNAISNYLPSILLLCSIFFPLEYYLDNKDAGLLLKILIMTPALILLYYISKFLTEKVFPLIDLKKSMPNYTRYFVTIIPIVSICLFQSWELFVTSVRVAGTTSHGDIFLILIFTGIVPIRLLYFYEPDVHIVNRIMTFACLVIYAWGRFTQL
ncbi:MAG: hypothetical protein JXA07_14015 [Spirochaetes bacterium]|nr:hypothetical protein [Spirochaetota bacterium]